jgi:hypothetical protein
VCCCRKERPTGWVPAFMATALHETKVTVNTPFRRCAMHLLYVGTDRSRNRLKLNVRFSLSWTSSLPSALTHRGAN